METENGVTILKTCSVGAFPVVLKPVSLSRVGENVIFQSINSYETQGMHVLEQELYSLRMVPT